MAASAPARNLQNQHYHRSRRRRYRHHGDDGHFHAHPYYRALLNRRNGLHHRHDQLRKHNPETSCLGFSASTDVGLNRDLRLKMLIWGCGRPGLKKLSWLPAEAASP